VPDRTPASARYPPPELTRREFVRGVATLAGVATIAPFWIVRAAPARTTDLEEYLHRKLAEANTPGIAVAVVCEGEVAWSTGVGWADRERRIRATNETVFQLASVSKTVTCAGIMALVEDGLIDLDADVNTYLPFEVHVPDATDVPITMRQLLTHTSAIRDRWQVWGTPWSQPTLYFHGDSPISLGEFCRSYFVHGGAGTDAARTSTGGRRGPDTRTRTSRWCWQGSWPRPRAGWTSTSCASSASSDRSG
jgi:hypothetical protein